MGTVFPHLPVLPVVSETQPLMCCYLKESSGPWLGRGWEAREVPVGPLAWGLNLCTGGFILAVASRIPPSLGSP